MSITLVDGFEIADNTSLLQRRYSSLAAPAGFTDGRNGGTAIQVTATASTAVLRWRPHVAASTPLLMGFAFYAGSPVAGELLVWKRGLVQVVRLVITTSGDEFRLQLYQDATFLAQSELLPIGSWYFIEAAAELHETDGRAMVRVDQVPLIEVEGVQTLVGSNAVVDQMDLTLAAPDGGDSRLDDMYAATDQWDDLPWLGDVKTFGLRPTGDEDTTWTPVGESQHAAALDDVAPDDDVTYVGTSDVDAREVLALSELDRSRVSGRVAGVAVSIDGRDTDPPGAPLLGLQTILHDAAQGADLLQPVLPERFTALWEELQLGTSVSARGEPFEIQEVESLQAGFLTVEEASP